MNAASASATAQIREEPYVNVSFSLQGRQLAADHGYLLYSAISRITSNASAGSAGVPSAPGYAGVPPARSPLHKTDWLAIELISGVPAGQGLIALPHNSATLRLRIPAENYRNVLPLAGKRLNIGGHQIRLGLPVARPLEPAASLYARVVTIKHHTEPESFLEAVKRKLDQFGIKGRVELPGDEQGRHRRRIVTIHGKSVVGFSVAVHDLNDEDSLLLQAGSVKLIAEEGSIKWQSIFSRRAMGCGIFNPISEPERWNGAAITS